LSQEWPIDDVKPTGEQSIFSSVIGKASKVASNLYYGSAEDERKKLFGHEAQKVVEEFKRFEKEEKTLEDVKGVFENLY